MKRFLALSLLLLAAPGMSGCVALAVPVATGLVMGGRMQDDAKDKAGRTNPATAPSPAPLAQGAATASGARAAIADPDAARALPGSPEEAQVAALSSAGAVTLAPFSEMPPPSGASPAAGGIYSDLFAKVTAIAQRDPFSQEARLSAFLADPAELKPERAECAFAQTAVLVDLDPGDGEAPLEDGIAAPEQLARVLATLRAQEVAVLWLSRHTAARAGAVRRALLRSGLDPQGRDELYLVRYEDESKATRRADAARDFCIVAILGDQKRDFDELFGFLKNPDAAFALDSLLGEAWFIAPAPLISTSPPEEG
ncbi:MAG: hypothetical protein GW855_09040 [Erythrobacter sp.]|nr:hypothetical protein [Erythrobacter sp.]NCQ63320.1 hypothetical protein [Alphaproteobacteria bacterium]